ncbi:uncharacterized protein BJ171DRAFT_601254 [Polychytrium aggregatum]|uniref:uncharacterized protein n=1 Tax=Polychytrium aggregatum TaxID=110093 RepID=UPI0022FE0E55|nr:uncharacterized protein BJ171DRAFT_601254 [Polychytrium aggregatum]KAI9202118.1 hypothetical protein BJ171DRAFT_601254 [Polychytrium aggregatum]
MADHSYPRSTWAAYGPDEYQLASRDPPRRQTVYMDSPSFALSSSAASRPTHSVDVASSHHRTSFARPPHLDCDFNWADRTSLADPAGSSRRCITPNSLHGSSPVSDISPNMPQATHSVRSAISSTRAAETWPFQAHTAALSSPPHPSPAQRSFGSVVAGSPSQSRFGTGLPSPSRAGALQGPPASSSSRPAHPAAPPSTSSSGPNHRALPSPGCSLPYTDSAVRAVLERGRSSAPAHSAYPATAVDPAAATHSSSFPSTIPAYQGSASMPSHVARARPSTAEGLPQSVVSVTSPLDTTTSPLNTATSATSRRSPNMSYSSSVQPGYVPRSGSYFQPGYTSVNPNTSSVQLAVSIPKPGFPHPKSAQSSSPLDDISPLPGYLSSKPGHSSHANATPSRSGPSPKAAPTSSFNLSKHISQNASALPSYLRPKSAPCAIASGSPLSTPSPTQRHPHPSDSSQQHSSPHRAVAPDSTRTSFYESPQTFQYSTPAYLSSIDPSRPSALLRQKILRHGGMDSERRIENTATSRQSVKRTMLSDEYPVARPDRPSIAALSPNSREGRLITDRQPVATTPAPAPPLLLGRNTTSDDPIQSLASEPSAPYWTDRRQSPIYIHPTPDSSCGISTENRAASATSEVIHPRKRLKIDDCINKEDSVSAPSSSGCALDEDSRTESEFEWSAAHPSPLLNTSDRTSDCSRTREDSLSLIESGSRRPEGQDGGSKASAMSISQLLDQRGEENIPGDTSEPSVPSAPRKISKALSYSASELLLNPPLDLKRLDISLDLWETSVELFEELRCKREMLFRNPLKNVKPILAAILYILCKNRGLPRSIKEFCAAGSITKKELSHYYRRVQEIMSPELKVGAKPFTAEEFLTRWCRMLNLPDSSLTAAMFIYRSADSLGLLGGKCTNSASAICLTLACLYLDPKYDIKNISQVSVVSSATLTCAIRQIQEPLAGVLGPDPASTLLGLSKFQPSYTSLRL